MRLPTTLLLASLLVLVLVSASPHPQNPAFSDPADRATIHNNQLTVNDDAIHKTGYYLNNQNQWEAFNLQGNPFNTLDNWITTQATYNLPSHLRTQETTYLLFYSCSYNQEWSCHPANNQQTGSWQLIIQEQQETQEAFSLVHQGEAQAEIVVASDAPGMVQLAAELLQKYVADMSGATLPINNNPSNTYQKHVYVGESEYTQALGITSEGTRDGGFKILTGEDYLVLLGDDKTYRSELIMSDSDWDALTAPDVWNNDYPSSRNRNYLSDYDIYENDGRGTVNAVHELLYEQGMRWYYPSADGTITPNKNTIAVPARNELTNPAFPIRDLGIYYKQFGHLSESRYPGGLEGTRDEHLFWLMSLRINRMDEYVDGRYPHGLDAITRNEYNQLNHPEYYAVWGGELMNGQDGNDQKPNLCSQELLEATIRYAKTMFDTYDSAYVSVWPADGFTRVSEHSQECRDKATPERGRDGAISNYVWDFVNEVAWAIHDDPNYGPEHRIMGGAYTAYQLPPTQLSDPRGVAPNIVAVLTKWRTWTGTPERQQQYQDLTQEWIDLLPSGQVITYDYYLHNRRDRTTATTPIFYPRLIAEDLAFLEGKTSGEDIEIFSNWPGWNLHYDSFAAEALNTYVTSRLYWEPQLDIDELLEEYYELYYGPAATHMKELIEYSENNFYHLRNEPEFLTTMRAMAQEALVAAGEETAYGRRVARLLGLINANYEGEEVTINSCQDLRSATSTYKLTSDVTSSGTCFFIDASAVTIDCQGHTITYDTSDSGGHGIEVNARRSNRGDYFEIRNCNIQSTNNNAGAAIRFHHADHGVINNNHIDTAGPGIRGGSSKHLEMTNNEIRARTTAYFHQHGSSSTPATETYNYYANNHFISTEGNAAYIYQGGEDELRNNEFISENDIALRLFRPTNLLLQENYIRSDSTNALSISSATNLQDIDNTIING